MNQQAVKCICILSAGLAVVAPAAHILAAELSVNERITAIEQRLKVIEQEHLQALRTLGGERNLEKGIEDFSHHIEQLRDCLTKTQTEKSLAAEAKKLASQLIKEVPRGSLDGSTAENIHRDSLNVARRAEALDQRVSAVSKTLEESLALAPKWLNTFIAFNFDPFLQDEKVRWLVDRQAQALISGETIPTPTKPPESKVVDKPKTTTSPIPHSPPQDELVVALAAVTANPNDGQAFARLNSVCFSNLFFQGREILAKSQPQLAATALKNLETAAKLRVPTAQQLMGMMHLTGLGVGINTPRGINYLKEAQSYLQKPGLGAFGPGVEDADLPDAVQRVGTVWFWLAECYLIGVMERDLGKACVFYQQAVQAGDLRAVRRIHELADLGLITQDDAQRWTKQSDKPEFYDTLGLAELREIDLSKLYEKELAQRSKPRRAGIVEAGSMGTAQPSSEEVVTALPYLGIYMEDLPNGADGVGVRAVFLGSPAQAAGLLPRDVIADVDGHEITNVHTLKQVLGRTRAGQQITVGFWRSSYECFSTQLTLGAVLQVSPAISCVREPVSLSTQPCIYKTGIRVYYVEPKSSAALAGLRNSDIIVAASDRAVEGLDYVVNALMSTSKKRLTVWRISESGQGQVIDLSFR